MMQFRRTALIAILVCSRLAQGQTTTPLAFDGIPMATWVARVVEDSSAFRRASAAAAIRRAPPSFRTQFVRHPVPALERGTPDQRTRALSAISRVVNEGQFGSILEERGHDLAAAVPALQLIANDRSDPNRRVVWFLPARTDSATRRAIAPSARLALRDPEPGIRWEVVRFLALVRDSSDLSRLIEATRDSSADVREMALLALSRWQPRRVIDPYMNALHDTLTMVREAAIVGLGRAGPAAKDAMPALLQILDDSMSPRSLRANAAWALPLILPRYDQENFIQVDVSDAGTRIRSDGRGPHVHGPESVQVTKAAMLNLALGGQHGDERAPTLEAVRPLARALVIDLTRPVTASGAKPLGVTRDNEATVHMGFTHVHERNMVSITRLEPNDTLTRVERVEFHFRLNGAAHLLQMGEWTQGEFNRLVPRVSGEGTTSASVAHHDLAAWTVSAPAGSVARLWDLSDPQHPVDRGLYEVPFRMRWSLVDPP